MRGGVKYIIPLKGLCFETLPGKSVSVDFEGVAGVELETAHSRGLRQDVFNTHTCLYHRSKQQSSKT